MSAARFAHAIRALGAFLVGAAPADRYLAPLLADWLGEQHAATGLRARLAIALRHAAPLAFTALFLLSRVERDGVLALLVPPLLGAVPGLFVCKTVGLAAAQAGWLALGAVLCVAFACVPPRGLVRVRALAAPLLVVLAATAFVTGSPYVRLPVVHWWLSTGELAKPLVVLAVFALASARGPSRTVQALLLVTATSLASLVRSSDYATAGAALSSHTDGVLQAIAARAGLPGLACVALGVGATALLMVRFAQARPARAPAWALFAMLVAQWGLHAATALGLVRGAGLALPFVSYGGSAIVGTWSALAVLSVLSRVPARGAVPSAAPP